MITRNAKHMQYSEWIAKLYPEFFHKGKSQFGKEALVKTITFQVTDACNLACKYCYQINKGKRKMKFETAKQFIDDLLVKPENLSNYADPEYSPAIIIDFIGGEPFLEIDLITQISEYFVDKLIELDHPWLNRFKFSLCSNGVLYFDPKVQHYLNEFKGHISLSITIDGNKELHDSCRVFPDGSPSYNIAIAAAKDWMSKGNYLGSKITIAPGNVEYIYDAITHMVELGYDEINANTVFEKGWTIDHAKTFYSQLIKIADYWIDNDLVETHYLSLFVENFFKRKPFIEDENWCGSTGYMLSLDPDGIIFPCIRYMESSLGCDAKPYSIGNIKDGIGKTKKDSEKVSKLTNIYRRSQSNDICFDCPIADGCAWCSAYNYQIYGTIDKRVPFSCIMHIARSLANSYFWNKWYRKTNQSERVKLNCPKEWALLIIDEDEYDKLKQLERNDFYEDKNK